jgi:FKBP-type peptidyl-prolyl cis-trans isomerase FklB
MKSSKVAMVGLGLLLMAGLAVGQDAAKVAAPSELKDMKAKASYAIGLGLGRNLKSNGADIDADLLARGVKDAVAGGKVLLTDDQVKEVMLAFSEQLKSKQAEMAKSAVEKNKKEGQTFLAANKAKPGVVTLPSGLQYKVIKEGTGKTPKATDTVSTHYRGTLLDGTEFDSSIKRGQPASFPVNGVIPGWTEALQKMKVGSKWQLFIPSELAYGASPPPGSQIGPNAVLIFDIELLNVE